MYKRLPIVSCAALFIAGGACSTGTAHPHGHGTGGRSGSGTPMNVGGNAEAITAGASSVAVAGAHNAAVPCGAFSVGTSSSYNTATLSGVVTPNKNTESNISLYDVAVEAPICAKGDVISPAQGGWGWAMLDLTLNAVTGTIVDGIAGAGQPTQTVDALIPQTEGLFVKIDNKGRTDLRICLQGMNFDQWCASYVDDGKLMAWNAFVEQSGSKAYAKQPLMSVQVTVPDQGGAGHFDFCIERIVEGASWCACPDGVCTCPAGNDACDGTCVPSTSMNPRHCGACENACPSTSACIAGQCVSALYPNLITPNCIAIDGAFVYFTEESTGNVNRASLGGGTPEILVSGQDIPTRLVVSHGNLFWVNAGTQANNYTDGTIMTLVNGVPTQLASRQNNAYSLAVDAQSAYWVNMGTPSKGYVDGAIMKIDLMAAGSSPVVLAPNLVHPRALAVDASAVYWVEQGTSNWGQYTTDGQVVRLGFDKTTPEILVPKQPSPMAIAVDASNVYFSTTDGVYEYSLTDGTKTTLADRQSWAQWLLVDGTDLYFTNFFDGSVMSVPIAGGSLPVTLARGQHYARAPATDGTNLYWVALDDSGAGGIMAMPK
jgi:hypothetical protein